MKDESNHAVPKKKGRGGRRPNTGGARKGAGRKAVLTLRPEVGDKIVALLRAGNFFDTAANAAGVRAPEAKEWLRRGSAPGAKEPFASWAARVNEAMAQSEAMGVAQIAQLGRKDWRALAWMLERRHGHNWRQIVAAEISGKNGGPIEVNATLTRYNLAVPTNPILGGGTDGEGGGE